MWRVSAFLSFERLRLTSFIKPNILMELPLITRDLQYQVHQASPQQLSKIEDASDMEKSHKLSKHQLILKFVSNYLPPIDLESTPLLWWNILVIFFITYNFIQIPIVVLIVDYVFDDPFFSQQFYYYDVIIMIVFLLDLFFIRWRVSFYEGERKNTNYSDVFKRYWKKYFPFDFISTFGLVLFLAIKTSSYFKLICFVRILSVWNIDVEIRNKIEMKAVWLGIYKFVRQMLFVFFILNLGACIYFFIDYNLYLYNDFFYDNHLLWLTGSGAAQGMNIIENFPWYVWYQYALYLLLQTSRGCGYGDFTPMNPVEAFFIVMTILVNQWIYSLFANGILQIVKQARENSSEKYHSLLNQGFWTYNLSYEVKEKSRKYVDSKLEIGLEERENYLMSFLSENLKKNYLLTFHREFWDNFSILNLLFQTEEHLWTFFALQLISTLKYKYYSEGDFIIQQNQKSDFKLILISRGIIKIMNSRINYEKKLSHLEYIGQDSFFFRNKILTDIRCESFTKIFYFQKSEFFKIIRKHQLEFELFSHHFDKARINEQTAQFFHLSCSLCEKAHLEEFCPVNEAWKSKPINLNQLNSNEKNQERQKYTRRHLNEKQRRILVKTGFFKKIEGDKCWIFTKYNPEFNIDSMTNL